MSDHTAVSRFQCTFPFQIHFKDLHCAICNKAKSAVYRSTGRKIFRSSVDLSGCSEMDLQTHVGVAQADGYYSGHNSTPPPRSSSRGQNAWRIVKYTNFVASAIQRYLLALHDPPPKLSSRQTFIRFTSNNLPAKPKPNTRKMPQPFALL
jgi:hypothetical protein